MLDYLFIVSTLVYILAIIARSVFHKKLLFFSLNVLRDRPIHKADNVAIWLINVSVVGVIVSLLFNI